MKIPQHSPVAKNVTAASSTDGHERAGQQREAAAGERGEHRPAVGAPAQGAERRADAEDEEEHREARRAGLQLGPREQRLGEVHEREGEGRGAAGGDDDAEARHGARGADAGADAAVVIGRAVGGSAAPRRRRGAGRSAGG